VAVNQHDWQVRMNGLCEDLAVAVIDQDLARQQCHNADLEIARVAESALDEASFREGRVRAELREHARVGLEAGFLFTRDVTNAETGQVPVT